jgi:pimeloyl-ACP methyl ester carboxylesterase
VPPASDNLSYTSTVDGFLLSYLEWLPAGFTASRSYPLAVVLHGVGSNSTWQPGGVGGQIDVTGSLVANASLDGFILMGLNTRTSDGFYVNSPCGGPQEQDVLDAIAHEKSVRSVSASYLIGFSMGSLGSFSIAGHHPGLIAGLATAGSITDIYETIAYNSVSGSDPHGLYDAMCGGRPGPSAPTVDRTWTYLSVLRFEPRNFSGIPLFVASGGLDTRAPNNFAAWAYANVNNTFVNSSCVVATALGEPPNCTTPFSVLSAQSPSEYRWLDLYEARAPHSPEQLPGDAVFGFFLDRIQGGFYVSTYPGAELVPTTPDTSPHGGAGSSGLPSLSTWDWVIVAGAGVAAVGIVVVVSRRRRR